MNHNQYPRWQETNIKKALKTRRVLLISGSRQCGKTTLSKIISTTDTRYYTLDDITLLESALNDPSGFIQHGNHLLIIDEIQRAPLLLQAIKQDVDENQEYGRFLLTGSANIQSLPSVKESLAGRIRNLRLRPLAQGEIHKKTPNFIPLLFKSKPLNQYPVKNVGRYQKDNYLHAAFSGGYPEVLRFKEQKDRRAWHKDFLSALMDKDLKDIANIRRKDSIQKLLEVLAAWSSKFMDISAIGAPLSITRPTIESYVNALESLYLIERVRPWHKTDYDRVSKQDKLFMTDTGLMASLLNWNFEDVRLNGDLNGKLIETLVFTELSAIIDAQDDNYSLFHYRDRVQREIDFIVEDKNGHLLGIEVKSGSNIRSDSFKHLKWFKENMAKDKPFKGIILYTGEHCVSFGDDLWAVPLHFMWDMGSEPQ
jgi:uncharacterized protein